VVCPPGVRLHWGWKGVDRPRVLAKTGNGARATEIFIVKSLQKTGNPNAETFARLSEEKPRLITNQSAAQNRKQKQGDIKSKFSGTTGCHSLLRSQTEKLSSVANRKSPFVEAVKETFYHQPHSGGKRRTQHRQGETNLELGSSKRRQQPAWGGPHKISKVGIQSKILDGLRTREGGPALALGSDLQKKAMSWRAGRNVRP